MSLSLDDKVAIVCDITNSFCKKEGIELPPEIQDFIQNPPKFAPLPNELEDDEKYQKWVTDDDPLENRKWEEVYE